MDWADSDERRGSKAGFPNRQQPQSMDNSGTGGGEMELKLLSSESAELEDPMDRLKTVCGEKEKCSQLREVLGECNERVNSREKTNETCEQELYDFLGCVNHCVAKDLFALLK